MQEQAQMVISLAPPLGAFAIIVTIPTLTFLISFIVVLRKSSLSLSIPAVVASSIGVLDLASIVVLIYLHFRCRSDAQDREVTAEQRGPLIYVAGLLCLLFSAVSLAALIWMRVRSEDMPHIILGISSSSLLIATFILWGLSLVAQLSFLLSLFLLGRSACHKSHSLHTDEEPHMSSEMQQTSRPQIAVPQPRGSKSSDGTSSSPKSTNSRKRSGSDKIHTIRSSVTQVVRPSSSKTRLVNHRQSYRPASLDSGTGEPEIVEDGFDSWDTSAVDPQSRQFVLLAANSAINPSPQGGRFLETIPASPVGSRSSSPGFPFDLEPPSLRRRSRSKSPAHSFVELQRRDRATSLTGSEAHIHPLFRTDSPTPPPTATPGTVVTAAPGAGQVMAGRRSAQRMRSASLPKSNTMPKSPLTHARSTDDVRRGDDMDNDDDDDSGDENSSDRRRAPSPPEREMTPPIPDWVLGAGPRNSMSGYTRRKGVNGLGPVGEARES